MSTNEGFDDSDGANGHTPNGNADPEIAYTRARRRYGFTLV